ncbi:helix-turn-helix domain-containing protein [Terriglobus albidus]|uniref:Helix-turn-helix domain-containing protein n=1 Tax=Terriglobus albidus TaxID=1592106 RepID=A0A5B9EFQ9_9BACT|nr:helix-turn-helix domain-containing protein [Terriglobus albidus]QEE30912.1 helix-turn-helix domain-containing protein [Terriglobus albidus]
MVNGSMAGFGEQLRRARAERGISLEMISERTKIAVRHLESLEEERFKDLPGGVFNRGMVRSYARVVGLDEQEWHDRFMECYRSSGSLKHDDADWLAFTENMVNSDQAADPAIRLRWAGVALMGLVFLFLATLAWYLLNRRL